MHELPVHFLFGITTVHIESNDILREEKYFKIKDF